jgi:hypothetical protein
MADFYLASDDDDRDFSSAPGVFQHLLEKFSVLFDIQVLDFMILGVVLTGPVRIGSAAFTIDTCNVRHVLPLFCPVENGAEIFWLSR